MAFGQQYTTTGASAKSTPVIVQTGTTRVASTQSADDAGSGHTLWMLVTFGGLYILWSLIDRHQKVDAAVKPSNVAVNLRFLAVFAVTFVFVSNLLKVLGVKLAAFFPHSKIARGVAKLLGAA